MKQSNYITLKDLEVYQLSRKLSALAWEIYSKLNYEQKKIIGDQFIRSADSVGANIAEGYARYHYLEKVRFYHFSRGSLSEAVQHWAELMLERAIINQSAFDSISEIHKPLEVKLNNFIAATLKNKKR
ncbi:MAG: four helix bundle protein [Chitinophagales bacterium]